LAASLPAYEVIEILGRGGMGAVYKARQKSLKRWVAIKVLPLVEADDELQFAERFRNEAETMAQMNHSSIVNVYDFGETPDGLLYIVMEFVDGTDVHKMIHGNGMLSGEYALAITAHVCDALAYAHARGVIHRDIKPANILIDQEGNVKVADFGLAKMSHTDYGLTRSNVAMGTPDYVAPEVLSYGMVADHRADLYAVGVMLYQMLTGEVPRGLFKLPSQKGIEADPRFDDIICKAMEPDRDERYQSAMDVRAALDVILTTALPKEEEAVVVATQGPVKKSSSRGIWFGVGGIVTVLGVAAFFVFGGTGKMKGGTASIGTSHVSSAAESKPVDAAFLAEVAAAPPEQQVELVRERIEALNGVKVKFTPTFGGDGKVAALTVDQIDQVALPDLSPLVGLRDLGRLIIDSPGLRDISWLSGMEIDTLNIVRGTFTDISVLNNLPLRHISLLTSSVSDFSSLAGKPLESFNLYGCRSIKDLNFIHGMPLNTLRVEDVELTDWSPLRGLPLTNLIADLEPEREADILRSLPTLKTFNGKPAEELWALIGNPVGNPVVGAASPETWTDRIGTIVWETPWSLKDGTLSTSAPTTMQELGQVGDGALRIRARVAAGTDKGQLKGPTLQPALRIGPVKGATDRQGSYQFQANFPGGACSLVYLERDLKTGTDLPPEYLWKDSALPRDLHGKEEIEWEFRAVGDELSAWADGQFVASARDARVTSGRSKLTAFPGIEIMSVETSGITPKSPVAANQNGLPNITPWQDVTGTVREKAQSIPQLVVESDRIRHVGQGSTPTLPLTKDGLHDYAVRIRFSGDAQVNLRTNPAGSLYVLCQGTKTIFQRYEKSEDVPTILIPAVPHPVGYESNLPHEFLVTMQGPTIRAWLDGRFVGEAHDDTFEDGTAGIALTKHSVVQKVEIAELAPSPAVASTDWQPILTQPEDFGTDAANVEIRDGWLFANTAKTHYAPTDSIDGAIRATLRFQPQHTADLTARANDGAPWGKEAYACSVFITPDGKTATIMNTMAKIDGEKPWKRHDFPLPAALSEGEEFALELRVEGDQIAVLFNGKDLGSVTHPFPATNRHFGIMTSTSGGSEFRDVALQRLE
jgi:tRNA A-37 threonylcarbamoyl transferase component Bud32